MNALKNSPKTTAGAIATLIALAAGAAALLLDGDPATNPDFAALIPVAILCVGVIFARDHDVSSESAGAK